LVYVCFVVLSFEARFYWPAVHDPPASASDILGLRHAPPHPAPSLPKGTLSSTKFMMEKEEIAQQY
jgi:hypothetical protein